MNCPSRALSLAALFMLLLVLPSFSPPAVHASVAGPSPVYVANFNGGGPHGSLSIVNSSSDKVTGMITVGQEPYGGAYDPVNKELYVVDYGTTSAITVVNSTDNKVIKTIDDGYLQPAAAAYDPHNGDVYVANYCTECTEGTTVVVMNTTTNKIVKSIDVGEGASGAVFDPENNEVYVTAIFADMVYVINDTNNKVITTMNDCFSSGCVDAPIAEALNLANDELYVANYNDNAVAVFNCATNKFVKQVDVGMNPDGAAYDPSNTSVYVANSFGNSLSVISSKNKVTGQVKVGSQPYGLAYDAQNNEIYVANFGADTVSAINGTSGTVVKTIKMGIGVQPIGIIVS